MTTPQGDREAFEKFLRDENITKDNCCWVDAAWGAWQAARAHFAKQDAEPVADVMCSLSDGSIGKEIAPRKWTTYKQELAKLMEHPWVKNGAAKIIPLYTAPPIPADMVMVPREPTLEQENEGMRFCGFKRENAICTYKAMIAAAPTKKEPK